MRRALGVIVVLVIVAFGACRMFLPERFAVNAPVTGIFLGAKPPAQSDVEKRMKLPPGFSVGIYADGIANARFMRVTANGDLLVSSPREKSVFLVQKDANGDGRADGVTKLVTGLDSPHGLEIVGEWLYIA